MTAGKIKTVKVTCDKSPFGARDDAALKHSHPAEKAREFWVTEIF